MSLTNTFLYFITAIGLVTFIDTVGALASRILNFKYVYLSVFSMAVYLGVGYVFGQHYPIFGTLILGFLIGAYDGYIGFRLAIWCKANYGTHLQEMRPILKKLWLYAGITAMLITAIGYLIS